MPAAGGFGHDDAAPSHSSTSLSSEIEPGRVGTWVDDSVGNGFCSDVREFGLGLGVGFAADVFGSKGAHDLVLTRFYYGWMLGDVVGKDRWYRGNWEVVQEIFGGVQYHPRNRYVIGETTFLRFNFATGTRWVPFLDAGVGILATDIGAPSLGSVFEFNEQFGAGLNYFWHKNRALTLEYRFIHISNAGIREPNLGVNENVFYAGVSWFF